MKQLLKNSSALLAAALGMSAFLGLAQIAPGDDSAAKPYKILETTQIPAAGRIDYVTADSVNRRVYVACGNAVSVFDLDTYKLAGTLVPFRADGLHLADDRAVLGIDHEQVGRTVTQNKKVVGRGVEDIAVRARRRNGLDHFECLCVEKSRGIAGDQTGLVFRVDRDAMPGRLRYRRDPPF